MEIRGAVRDPGVMVGSLSSGDRWHAFLALLLACAPDPGSGTPCTRSEVVYTENAIGRVPVDVLLVLDESEVMAAARSALARELPRLIESLASGADPTGVRFEAPAGLRFGVVTADMGGPGCEDDDGVLRDAPSCEIMHWLDFARGPDDVSDAGERAQCAVESVDATCSVAQPLEAALKALTPSTSDTRFAGGTAGHGDGLNDGFDRWQSTLVVVTLTQGDDCSIADPALLDLASPEYTGPLARRCTDHPEALHSIDRFIDGLLALRADNARDLYLMPVGGVPLDLLPDPERALAPQVEVMLTDPRLSVRADPTDPDRTLSSCTSEALGPALPPRRLLQTAAGVDDGGSLGLVGSTCGDDLEAAIDTLITAVGVGGAAGCQPFSRYPRQPDGRIRCELSELFDPSAIDRCENLPGRRSAGHDEETGLLRCSVHQVAIGADGAPLDASMINGWAFDDFSDFTERYCPRTEGRFAWMGDARRSDWGSLRLRCYEADFVAPPGVGEACDGPCATPAETSELFGAELACEPISATCLPSCSSEVGCIDGWTCLDVDGDGAGYCVNATCP
jgi:hypothetical protein